MQSTVYAVIDNADTDHHQPLRIETLDGLANVFAIKVLAFYCSRLT